MQKIVNQIIKELLKEQQNPTIQLGGYLLTGEPTYLPKSARKYDRQLNRAELMEYIVEKLIDDYKNHKGDL